MRSGQRHVLLFFSSAIGPPVHFFKPKLSSCASALVEFELFNVSTRQGRGKEMRSLEKKSWGREGEVRIATRDR